MTATIQLGHKGGGDVCYNGCMRSFVTFFIVFFYGFSSISQTTPLPPSAFKTLIGSLRGRMTLQAYFYKMQAQVAPEYLAYFKEKSKGAMKQNFEIRLIDDSRATITFQGKTIPFAAIGREPSGDFTFEVNAKKINLSGQDSPSEVWNKVSSALPYGLQGKLYWSMLIPQAHAFCVEPLTCGAAAAVVAAAFLALMAKSDCQSAGAALKVCQSSNDEAIKNGRAPEAFLRLAEGRYKTVSCPALDMLVECFKLKGKMLTQEQAASLNGLQRERFGLPPRSEQQTKTNY